MGRISPGCQKIKVPKKRGSNRRGCKHGGVCRCKTKTQPPLRVLRRRRLRKRPNIASDVERKTRGRFGQHSWLQDGEQTQRSLAVSQLGRFPRLVQHSHPRNLVSPCTPLCLCVHQATSLSLGALLVCRCRAAREAIRLAIRKRARSLLRHLAMSCSPLFPWRYSVAARMG